MKIVIVVCLAMLASGIYVLLKHPNAAIVGIPLTAIPALILVQAFLLAFARILRPIEDRPAETPESLPRGNEFIGIFHAYCDFKLFLARMVGFAAIAYGIITFDGYFLAAGAVSVFLFWIWDRMIAVRQNKTENKSEAKVTVAEK